MNKTLRHIIKVLSDFDFDGYNMHQEKLEICIPQALYRYAAVDSEPAWHHWDPVDIRLTYTDRELQFSINLSEKSYAANFSIVEHSVREDECVTDYRTTGTASLTMRDARQLLVFLQNDFFRGFDFNVITKRASSSHSSNPFIISVFSPPTSPSSIC